MPGERLGFIGERLYSVVVLAHTVPVKELVGEGGCRIVRRLEIMPRFADGLDGLLEAGELLLFGIDGLSA